MTFFKGQKIKRKKRKEHRSTKEVITTNKKYRVSLDAIRQLLAEQGYQIYPVATWFRRSKYDFVAVPRAYPQQLLVVRPAKRNATEFRYFTFANSYNRIRNYLDAHSDTCGRMVWGRQLPAGRKDKGDAWRLFVSRTCLLELKLFVDS